MNTEQSQVKLNLPKVLKEFAESRAGRFGLPLAAYIKHLILKDVEDMKYPVFNASTKTLKAYNAALKDQSEGKLIKVGNVNKFFDEL